MRTSHAMNAWKQVREGSHDFLITFKVGAMVPAAMSTWVDEGWFQLSDEDTVVLATASEGPGFLEDTEIRLCMVNVDTFERIPFLKALRHTPADIAAIPKT